MAYELIETIEVGSGGTSLIEFTSIPQDGTDLLCIASVRGGSDNLATLFQLNLNGDTTSANYSNRLLYGNGSSVVSNTDYPRPNFFINSENFVTVTANTFANGAFYIANYSEASPTTVSVDAVGENNGSVAPQNLQASIYNLSNAITSITLNSSRSGIVEFSSVSLYKIS